MRVVIIAAIESDADGCYWLPALLRWPCQILSQKATSDRQDRGVKVSHVIRALALAAGAAVHFDIPVCLTPFTTYTCKYTLDGTTTNNT